MRWKESLKALPIGVAIGLLVVMLGLQLLVSYQGCVAYLSLVFGAIAGGCVLVFGTKRGNAAVLSVLILFQFLFFVVAYSPIPRLLVEGLKRDDVTQVSADAVYVFASSIYENGQLSDIALARLLRALEVVQSGQAKTLVLSELPAPTPRYETAARALIEKTGMKPIELQTVGPVGNSYDEALEVAKIGKQLGWRKLVVVTSELHSRRACGVIEKQGFEVICAPALETRFDLSALANTRDRLLAFSGALYERLGTWVYARRGWL